MADEDNNYGGVPLKLNQETASTTNFTKSPQQQQHENLKNKITRTNRTLSIATQTDDDDPHMVAHFKNNNNNNNCDNCGNQMICWNCDKSMINLIMIKQTKNSSEIRNCESVIERGGMGEHDRDMGGAAGTMIGNKGELLLQAIQRTGHAHSTEQLDKINDNNNKLTLFNNLTSNKSITSDKMCERSECDKINIQLNKSSGVPLDASDCRECKRQKTKHNYTSACPSSSAVDSSTLSSYRRTMSECLVGLNEMNMLKQYFGEESQSQSQSSPSRSRKCMDANAICEEDLKCGELKKYRRAFSEDTINGAMDGEDEEEQQFGESNDDDECIVIKCHCPPEEEYKTTPIANLQQLEKPLKIEMPAESCVSTSSSISPHKKQIIVKHTPKINLAKLFNQNDSGIGQDVDSPDGNNNLNQEDQVFNFNTNKDKMDCFCSPPGNVSSQLQLSPRFMQSNALLKRRSRNFSDRSSISERSSIGSDEHLSDDDYHYLMQLNLEKEKGKQQQQQLKTTPSTVNKISLYKKFATKSHVAFNKLPLLGTLEESLLKNRFQPKSEVSGFNVLLGASGNFCPTQLTIPAQTYFYEFHGLQHMATPYVVSFYLFLSFWLFLSFF